jgi:hypothetical protein
MCFALQRTDALFSASGFNQKRQRFIRVLNLMPDPFLNFPDHTVAGQVIQVFEEHDFVPKDAQRHIRQS